MFAGIGGFHIAMHSIGGTCVFASECDTFARASYEHNYKKNNPSLFENENFNCNIYEASLNSIPDFDVLCAGFPCQPFSHAGLKKGFTDTRGTLFFTIAKIIKAKKNQGHSPKVILLENVKGLKGHDGGRTLKKIINILHNLNYDVASRMLNSKHFGLPQNRERLFIVAWLKGVKGVHTFNFPLGLDECGNPIFDEAKLSYKVRQVNVGDIVCGKVNDKYTLSDRLYRGHVRRLQKHRAKGNGFGFSVFNKGSPYTRTLSARYGKDGSEILIAQKHTNPRKLTPKEAGQLQGFPIDAGFEIVVSDCQAYKQFGNSVSIPVVQAIAIEIQKQFL